MYCQRLHAWVQAILIAALAFAAGSAEAPKSSLELKSLSPPVLLPDGTEFKTWEAPVKFTHTYYVDASAPNASENNPGSKEAPFATINKAAQVLQPGERVVVASGVYRERVKPARGGTSPTKMISYEAAPGAKVVLKGSRIFKPAWQPALIGENSPANVWQAPLDAKYFDGYNPFDIDNVTPKQFESMDWATPLRGKTPFTLARGLIFQDGKMLTQLGTNKDLFLNPGSYWIDRPKQTIYIHPIDHKDPRVVSFEITTQETVFAPEQMGLGFIRVKGFIVEHAAGPWPWEQIGAISTTRGHHWMIEENTIRWVNGVGVDVGIQHFRFPQPAVIGYHIVRRNTVTDCGICGICGLGSGREFGLLIEDNVIERNSFFDAERLYELAGIKTHNNVRCLIRRNLIVDTQHGAGIWMDWNNQFSRCMQNIVVASKTIHGGIFVEASYEPNLIDHNFIWFSEGHGIYEHDSCNQIFAHNFIGQSTKSAMLLNGKVTDRRISGREIVGGRHIVRNNVFVSNQKANVYRGEPSEVADNLNENITAQFDVSKLELTWSAPDGITNCQPVKFITHDFWGQPRSQTKTVPGLFNTVPSKPETVKLWRSGKD